MNFRPKNPRTRQSLTDYTFHVLNPKHYIIVDRHRAKILNLRRCPWGIGITNERI